MDIQGLLQGRACECGREHRCEIEHVVIKAGAINEIGALTANYRKVVLAADENTYRICGAKVEEQLGSKLEKRLVFYSEGVLIPNEAAIEALSETVSEETDLILGVGSGVIQDLCKYVSFVKKLPYYIVATAPSMDGYASSGAAMIIGNMKVTYQAHVPKAIIGDVDILKDAPMEMIQSGYGDIIGKLSCLADWKLSVIVNGEYFCQYVYDLTMEAVESIKGEGANLQKREENAVQKLMEALILVGIAMAYVGNSRPASGSEHHLSHYFEVIGIMEQVPYFMHGIDVVYSSVVTSRMRERISAEKAPSVKRALSEIDWRADVRRLYGKAADGVIELQEKLKTYETDHSDVYRKKWPEITAVLREAASSEEILGYIESVGLDFDSFVKMYGREKIEQAAWYAKDLKDRYSVLWLNYALFYKQRTSCEAD